METSDKIVMVFNKPSKVKEVTLSQPELLYYDKACELFYKGIGSHKELLIEGMEDLPNV